MNIQDAVLGETKHTFQLDAIQADAEAVALLINQARSVVNIYSKRLYPLIYDSSPIIEACHQFCMRSSRTKINILVDHTRLLSQKSHRLLSLSHRHSSSIFIKKTHPDFIHRSDEFCCIDRNAYFKLNNSEHYLATCNFSDSLITGDLLSFYKDAWGRSAADPELSSYVL